MLSQQLPQQNPAPILCLKKKVRRCLASYGFQEIITYSLTGLEMSSKLTPESHSPQPMAIRLANPMTADQEYLRHNLRANLLATLSANRRHEDGGLRLFELGKVYLLRPNDLPNEPEALCCVLSGARFEKSWLYGEEPLSFFDAKGIVEGLLNHLGVEVSFEHCDDNGLHPAKQAAIVIAGDRLGVVGELHPEVSDAFEISEPVYLFEIDVTALIPFASGHRMFHSIPRFPSIVRDMALVVDVPIDHQRVHDIIRSFALVSQVAIFDVYSGEQVPPGKKSLAYRVVYLSPDHTLTDEEVDKVQQQILDRLSRELGATLRT